MTGKTHHITAFSTLLGAALVTLILLLGLQSSVTAQVAPVDVLNLSGIVRDFSSTHPDFGITNFADMGHYVGTVAPALSADRRPVATGSGLQVVTEWYDQSSNPIAPNAGPGLPGGHFDVDVFDAPTMDELYHKHQYDDTYDITFIDVANDANLEKKGSWYNFDAVIGAGYPHQLRMVFDNVHNGGGGTYRFDAGAGLVEGLIADGFTTIFDPAQLVELRITFVSLASLSHTQPGVSQDDVVDRDDAFRIRMYDTVTNVMVYEFVVYHHFKDKDGNGIADDMENLEPIVSNDSCDNQINDIAGVYGTAGNAGITDSTSFGQWFRDELGVNQSTYFTISLQRDAMGVYEYMTDSFFPIDGILRGNEGDPNNNLFTYVISASFTYNACTGQFFEFESNDDAWAFVDSKLVIDLGGTVTPERQYVDLDRLGLVDGRTYTIEFFFAHRRVALESLFHMRTNMQLVTGTMPTVLAFYD
ncbi:MAG: fibro-slime domain-containing protein [Planctomycetes bacterium]|nr:fibro-slime domain-containing protein [Planctomycetota bacterium]